MEVDKTFSQVNIFVNEWFKVKMYKTAEHCVLYSKCHFNLCLCLLMFCKFRKSVEAFRNLKFLSFFGKEEDRIPTYCTSIIHSMTTVYCYVCALASSGIPGPELLTCYYRVATKGHLRCHWNNWNPWQSHQRQLQTQKL